MNLLEWFTNSSKYGAHSVAGGRVDITWDLMPPGVGGLRDLRLRWRESGGPPPVAKEGATTPSLGTELVRSFAGRELRGRCVLRYPPSGAEHLLEFPLD